MQMQVKTYYPANSLIHRVDARVKIVLLAAATVALFLVKTLPIMAICAAVVAVLVVLSRIPLAAYAPFMPAALVFGLCPLLFTGLAIDVYSAQEALAQYYGVTGGADPLVIAGSFGVVPAGLVYGAVLGLRIFLLIVLSLVFTFTTDAEAVVKAISWFLAPLRCLGVPVRDVATVFSLALRFIPLIAQELQEVANAHRVRGSQLDSGPITQRVRAWGNVFIPLFVRLFRRAETMGTAMDARCYGMKTGKNKRR